MSKKILLEHAHVAGIETLAVYQKMGGYESVRKALKSMSPDAVVEEVKKKWIARTRWSWISYGYEMEFFGEARGSAEISTLQCGRKRTWDLQG